MRTLREFLAATLSGLVLLATTSSAVAMPMYAPPYQEADQAALTASDIENIVSPIALYPDQLIAQILGAATYPDQVTAASNYVNSSSLKGDALMKAVDGQPWDPSVKALTQFPTVLDQMAKNLAWTSALGDAAFNQQKDVMTAIQKLRQEAKAAGNLKTTKEIKVVQESPQTIVIQQASPTVVYVPTYNPTVVYGTPYNPPGYSTAALVTTGLISFGVGMAIGASMNNSCCGWGYYGGGWGCNWHGGNVMYQNNIYVSRSNTFYGNNRYHNNSYYKNNNRPVPYNNNGRYNANNRPNNKQAWSGNNNSGRGNGNKVNVNGDVNIGSNNKNRPGNNNNANNRPGNNNNANNRPGNNAGDNRPGNNAGANNRPGNNNAANRPNAGNNNRAAADRGFGGNKPQTSNASALGGYKQGGNARADANRGKQSMGGGGGGGRQAPAARPAGGGGARKR